MVGEWEGEGSAGRHATESASTSPVPPSPRRPRPVCWPVQRAFFEGFVLRAPLAVPVRLLTFFHAPPSLSLPHTGHQVQHQKGRRRGRNVSRHPGAWVFVRARQVTSQKTKHTQPTHLPPPHQVLRFYMRCSACSAEITFKTDPENSSYTVEHGATANWVPWQPGGGGESGGGPSSSAAPPPPEAEGDAMAALEARVAASKRELDMLDAVDELRARAAARAALAPDAALAALAAADGGEGGEADPDAEDEAAVARMLAEKASRVARLADDEETAAAPPPPASTTALAPPPAARRGVKPAVVVVKKRPAAAAAVDGGAAKKAAPAPASDDDGGGGLVGLVGGYGSSSSE